MPQLRVGNAPCSWGTLEFEETQGQQIGFEQMVDELVETGYTGTELGDWGYMPTDPERLRSELCRRNVAMLGAFVQGRLKDRSAHADVVEKAVKTARLLAAVATDPKPFLVLADANGSDPVRTKNAGRIMPDMGLSASDWKIFCEGAESVAEAVLSETGLQTVFHHHAAGYVETPDEIARFLDGTNPSLVGLVFDTGHYSFGASHCNVLEGLNRLADRVWYIHLKDCDPDIASQSRAGQWDYFEALRHGIFSELGRGCVDFPAVLRWLRDCRYGGYVLVEQDIVPGMGTPKESARRNRDYLRTIESNYSS